MWQETQLVAHHPKWPGIVGDSLTFLGSILLTLEALFRPAQNLSVDRKGTIVKYFKTAERADGEKLKPEDVKRGWEVLWTRCNRIGVVLLVIGFGFLLGVRLFAE